MRSKYTFTPGRSRAQNAGHLMVDKRVVEALQHVAGKLLQFVHREVEGLHQFVELHLVDVLANDLVVASVANDVDTAEVGNRRKHGMRTIEEGHLALVIGLLALCDEHVKTGFLGGEFSAQLFASHVFCFLNHPKVENLGLHDQVVLVADFLLYFGDFLAGEAGDDAVDEGGADIAVLGEPLLETFIVGSEVVFP